MPRRKGLGNCGDQHGGKLSSQNALLNVNASFFFFFLLFITWRVLDFQVTTRYKLKQNWWEINVVPAVAGVQKGDSLSPLASCQQTRNTFFLEILKSISNFYYQKKKIVAPSFVFGKKKGKKSYSTSSLLNLLPNNFKPIFPFIYVCIRG